MGYYIRQHIFCGGRGRGDFQLKRKGYKENIRYAMSTCATLLLTFFSIVRKRVTDKFSDPLVLWTPAVKKYF